MKNFFDKLNSIQDSIDNFESILRIKNLITENESVYADYEVGTIGGLSIYIIVMIENFGMGGVNKKLVANFSNNGIKYSEFDFEDSIDELFKICSENIFNELTSYI